MQLVLNVLMIFYIPIHVIYGIPFIQLIALQICIIVPIFLLLDIMINLLTGYFEKG